MTDLHDEQLQREHALRQAALGRRVAAVEEGHLGPILRRWINADIVPIANDLRRVSQLYLDGDMEGVALALGTPTTALSQRERPLRPLMEWCHRGKSPGRGELKMTTFAEDISLAFMGTLIPRLAASGENAITLSSALALAAEAIRETVQGQFITSIQGAEAMQRVRENNPEKWQQRRSLRRIASMLNSQVKPQLLAEDRGEVDLPVRGSRKVLSVQTPQGKERRIELTKPDTTAWEVMSLCFYDLEKTSADHPYKQVWLSFAAMLLSLAQQSGGWFEVADKFKQTSSSRRKHKTKMLCLSERAVIAIEKDVERWVGGGFIAEPMLVPPVDGDFLTVKHRKVTGQRPPKGLITKPEGTAAWAAACALAESPWEVNELSPALELSTEEDPWLAMKLASFRRLGGRPFYLPVNMDFRGRMYYRTPWVTPQSSDLGKSLLRFPRGPRTSYPEEAIALHFSALRGNDKEAKEDRLRWWDLWWTNSLERCEDDPDFTEWDSPLTAQAQWRLLREGRWDEIPIQLDGTCNGLQHLSALMRDEVGAAEVNLTKGGSTPRDIYLKVGSYTTPALEALDEPWALRLRASGLAISRSLCKKPVMVLPYGGTLDAIRINTKEGVLEQLGWKEGDLMVGTVWHQVEEDGFGAFANRNLPDHPLFNEDIRKLAALFLTTIKPVIPKAMACMDTLQEIGKWLGSRAIAWRTGPLELSLGQGGGKTSETSSGLWVYQAKSKAARKRVTMKGFHLPDVIRRLTLTSQSNEVDPRSHKTGIVANFIHSLDAAHLARAILRFKQLGGSCVGGIHDCVLVRPSEVHLMHHALRETFKEMYEEDPLSQPVKVITTEGVDEGEVVEYPSWYALAEAAGVEFPEKGSWEPASVLDSQWFFA